MQRMIGSRRLKIVERQYRSIFVIFKEETMVLFPKEEHQILNMRMEIYVKDQGENTYLFHFNVHSICG